MGVITLVGLLASILAGLKNSAGQPLIPAAIGSIVTGGEQLVASIISDVQVAKATTPTSSTAVADDLQSIQILLNLLKSEKVISAQTLSQITALEKALADALAAEQTAQQTTDTSTLTQIPAAT